MKTSPSDKEGYNDLASLFLPDILHPVSSASENAIKQEDMDQTKALEALLTRNSMDSTGSALNDMMDNGGIPGGGTGFGQMGQVASGGIGGMPMNQGQNGRINHHYSNLIPIEALSMLHSHQHPMYSPMSRGHQQLYGLNLQTMGYGYPTKMTNGPNNDLGMMMGGHSNGFDMQGQDVNKASQNMYNSFSVNNFRNSMFETNTMNTGFSPSFLGSTQSINVPMETHGVNTFKANDKVKKNPKQKKSQSSAQKLSVEYKPQKLTQLLDLKPLKNQKDYVLLDKDGNELRILFHSFLNGRFFTNSIDNSNYIYSKQEGEKDVSSLLSQNEHLDPKVISCYRRNYIQIAMNLNLSGFVETGMDDNKIVKLQTNEYGYSVTRVVKWFRISVFAVTNVSNTRNVPIIICNDSKDKDKDLAEDADSVVLQPLNSDQNILTLHDSIIKDSEIDNYYIIKKLQFKNATPNNGNLTFQSYYHLRLKVSAVVADPYYDDYIDESTSINDNDNNCNEINLFELGSEPIIVRGRNPSFYSEKNDILIKNRSINSRTSFKESDNSNVPFNEAGGESSSQIHDTNNAYPSMEDRVGEDESHSIPDDENGTNSNDAGEEDVGDSNESDSRNNKTDTDDQVPSFLHGTTTVSLNALKNDFNTSSSYPRYKYFPVTSVYYLPPINTVYFPHRVHQKAINESDSDHSSNSIIDREDVLSNATSKRKHSNIYFSSV